MKKTIAILTLAFASLHAPRTPLMAQTFPSDDPVIRKIWEIGMNNSQTENLSQVLFDSIGPRLTGTRYAKSGHDWLVKEYKSWGIDAKNEQWGTWRSSRRGHSHIDLISPRVRTLEGTMLGLSPGTRGKDVDMVPIILPLFKDSTEFVKWLPNVKGKAVLVAAPKASCRPPSDWTQFGTPESKARNDSTQRAINMDFAQRVRNTGYSLAIGTGSLGLRLDAAGAGAVVTSRPKTELGTNEIFETYNNHTPAITLMCEDYGLVYRLTQNNQHPKLRLNLDAEVEGERPAYNTVAMMKGTTKPDEYVVLSSHFDSWDGSSGATDNGTGTITMLEAMRILKQAYPNPKRTIVSGHWQGEEEGEVGSRAFAEDHPEVLTGMQALFNQDNGTGRIVNIGGAGLVNSPEHIDAWLAKIPTEFKEQAQFRGSGSPAGGGSDDFSFACHGMPAFGLSALNWNYSNETWHTNRDTYDKIVFDDLKRNATLTAMLAYLASEDPTMISRERVDLAARFAQQQAQAASNAAANPNANNANSGRGAGGRPQQAPTWPVCAKAPRVTEPRIR